jgi:hypothetical protein
MDRKEGKKAYMKEYRIKNKERIKEQTKKYLEQNIEKIKKRRKQYYEKNSGHFVEYRKKPEVHERKKKWKRDNSESVRKEQKKYAKKYPEKIKAHNIARQIPLGATCHICESKRNLQKHHWRYDKPLIVATLCSQCHTAQHVRREVF